MFKSVNSESREGYTYCPYIPLVIQNDEVIFEVETRIEPSTWIPNENSARYLRDKYYENHKACPICKSKHTCQTLVGYTFDSRYPELHKDENSTTCQCGWTGIVHDLIN